MKTTINIFLLLQLITINLSISHLELPYFYKEYIESFGHKLEEHQVTTEDGYILTLWHLAPNSSVDKNKVVYFQHGFTCTAWVFFQMEENSLPFLLLDQGYDVWLGNSRGTIFSLDHISKDYKKANGDYWDFSIDENVIYDLPASMEYVKQTTGASKINYIGHSQGTTVFFMLYMHNPSYLESSINKFIGLGTVPNIAYSKSLPMTILDKIYDVLKMVKPLSKAIGFSDNQRSILSGACEKAGNICLNSFEKLASLTPTYRAKIERLFPFLYYYPGGTSANTVLHWSQIYKERKLVYFNKDYSDEFEMKEYDTKNIKKWKIKSLIQRSDSDSFSSYDDVTEFYETIENKSLIKLLDTPMYGHTDDLVADSALDEVYIPVADFLDE